MFILQEYSTAVIFCFITMICWGSWANTQKMASASWRFELFYWDYVFGILITSLLFALTLGSTGQGGRSFISDLSQAQVAFVGSALLGGAIFNAGNILLVASIALAGMSVAFPVGIGIALVWGVVLNYINNPVGDPVYLFSGVALVVTAILLNAFAYRHNSSQKKGVSARGLFLSVAAGILMGFFYKFVAASMFTDFSVPESGKLSPYSAVFLFSIGVLLSNFVLNTILMRKPIHGDAVRFQDYFKGGMLDHTMGLIGGGVWCLGMSFNILASDKAGPAISYGLGQGATVIAAVWGIYIWKEFHGAVKGTPLILNGMLVCYLAGLALLVAAR